MLDKNNNEPLYIQLYKIFKSKIEQGDLREGYQLPSENTLTDEYQVSRSTVRQMLSELEKNGYIYKERGRGSFVSVRPFQQNLDNLYSFSNEMKKYGKNPKYELICLKKIEPNENIRRIMKLNEEDKVYKFEIIRKIENEPILFETTYLPAKRFKDFDKVNLNENALYDILQNTYNVSFSNAEQVLYPILADSSIKKHLCIKDNIFIACMKIERISYEKEQVVEYTVAVVKGEKFKYKIVY